MQLFRPNFIRSNYIKYTLTKQTTNIFSNLSKNKNSNVRYTDKKIRNILKRETTSGSGKGFLNPTRFQRQRRKERYLTNKKKTLRLLNKYKEKKSIDEDYKYMVKLKLISKRILYKYKNPYMEYLCKNKFAFAAFVRNQKPIYYNYYQINYILDKKKCSLYTNFKEHKLFLDNQEYFLKYFTKRESRVYLDYLFFFTYSNDHFVKSNKIYCINRDKNNIKEDYNEIIINKIFGAQKILYSKNFRKIPIFYNKKNNNIDPKLYDIKSIKKLSKIAIPKYYLNIKPILSDINYLFIKDVPKLKIPKICPNYFPNDLSIIQILKNIILKNKYSIYVINYKECMPGKYHRKKSSKKLINKSKDNNILNSFISNDSKNIPLSSDRNNSSKYHDIHNIHSAYRRLKEDIDIYDVENLVQNLINKETKNDESESFLEDIEKSENYENRRDIFLSTLKKPFIGNRTKKQEKLFKIAEDGVLILDKAKKEIKSENTSQEKIDITKALHNKIIFLKKKNEEIRKKYPLNLYIKDKKSKNKNMFNLFLNFYDVGNYNISNDKNKNMLNNYFPDRFLNPKKYREYLINSPFLKVLQNIESSEQSQKSIFKPNIIKTLGAKQNNYAIINNSFSPNKKIYSFKETHNFLIGMNKKENRNDLRQKIYNKTCSFYQQFKTLNYATKNRSNFKKSGAFSFSSFSGSNYDKTENEWKDFEDTELQNSYINSFYSSNLMKKIKSDFKKKQWKLKNCTTFKEIAKCPNIYI